MATKYILSAFIGLSLTGCSWVELAPEAENVHLLTAQQTQNCNRVSRTTAQVLDKVWLVGRSEKKMAEELSTLAKNTAAELGHNAIVVDSTIEEGKQSFIVFDCPHLK